MTNKRKPGFTLIELLVAVLVSSILIGITVATYSLFRKSMNLDQSKADIAQNARIALDRLSREIRQTPDIVTHLPDSPSDTSVTQPGEIEFEDGHDNDLTYHRYYISGTLLKLDEIEYYFSGDPTYRVKWNASGGSGQLVKHVITTQDIADSVLSLSVYGFNEIQIILITRGEGNQQFPLRTVAFGRNI